MPRGLDLDQIISLGTEIVPLPDHPSDDDPEAITADGDSESGQSPFLGPNAIMELAQFLARAVSHQNNMKMCAGFRAQNLYFCNRLLMERSSRGVVSRF